MNFHPLPIYIFFRTDFPKIWIARKLRRRFFSRMEQRQVFFFPISFLRCYLGHVKHAVDGPFDEETNIFPLTGSKITGCETSVTLQRKNSTKKNKQEFRRKNDVLGANRTPALIFHRQVGLIRISSELILYFRTRGVKISAVDRANEGQVVGIWWVVVPSSTLGFDGIRGTEYRRGSARGMDYRKH